MRPLERCFGQPVNVGVVPEEAGRLVARNGYAVMEGLTGIDQGFHDVVGTADGTGVRPVIMNVGGRARHGVRAAIGSVISLLDRGGGRIVREGDAQGIAGVPVQSWLLQPVRSHQAVERPAVLIGGRLIGELYGQYAVRAEECGWLRDDTAGSGPRTGIRDGATSAIFVRPVVCAQVKAGIAARSTACSSERRPMERGFIVFPRYDPLGYRGVQTEVRVVLKIAA